MANRPAADKDTTATPRKPATKKAGKKTAKTTARKATPKAAKKSGSASSARKTASGASHSAGQAHASQSTARPASHARQDGPEVLKQGVSKLFSRGRELLSEKGPGLLNSLERATVVAIDQTSKGLTAFEKGANELEAKVGQGLKDLLDRRRHRGGDGDKPKGPRA